MPAALETIVLDDRDTFGYIRSLILLGQFTPFLGAGASSLRPSEPPLNHTPWMEIWVALLAISTGLRKPEYRKYLQSFAEYRLRLSKEKCKLLDGVSLGGSVRRPLLPPEPDWPSGDLLEFQRAVVSVASEMGKSLGAALAETSPSIDRIADLELPINPETSASSDLLSELMRAVDSISVLKAAEYPRNLVTRGRITPPALLRNEIYDRLIVLTIELVNKKVWRSRRFAAWKKRHHHRISNLPSDLKAPSCCPKLRVDAVEWLSELLWYSLRYWAPLPPTTAEMAFDLSLKLYLAPPRKPDLAQAAEAFSVHTTPSKLVDELKSRFEYIDDRHSWNQRFQVAIAAVLQHMYSLYRDRNSNGEKKGDQAVAAHLPVVFTTNFDRSMESVFEELKIDHHVVYPLRPRYSAGALVKWRFCTRGYPGVGDFSDVKWCDEVFPEDNRRRLLLGPVIVKLHGSPLEKPDDNMEHWIVLSEFGYLQALDHKRSILPQWIEHELAGQDGAPRSLWFLGYSVSDWNVRLRLYEHLRHSSDSGVSPERRAVDRRRDSFRAAILSTLRIRLCRGELNLIPSIIQDALETVPQQNRSRELERLLETLAEVGV